MSHTALTWAAGGTAVLAIAGVIHLRRKLRHATTELSALRYDLATLAARVLPATDGGPTPQPEQQGEQHRRRHLALLSGGALQSGLAGGASALRRTARNHPGTAMTAACAILAATIIVLTLTHTAHGHGTATRAEPTPAELHPAPPDGAPTAPPAPPIEPSDGCLSLPLIEICWP